MGKIRNNEDRTAGRRSNTGHEPPASIKEQMASVLDFVTPTEVIDLPSRGRGYPEGHPLYGADSIEIRFMTAKDEDILTSRSLLKKGLALDRLISNVIVDRSIKASDLLVGDRNAILINARSSAYGEDYEASVQCPNCGAQEKQKFDLSEPKVYAGDDYDEESITQLDNGNYEITLPYTKIKVEVKLLRGVDERKAISNMQKKNKNQPESLVTDQMELFIVSVNEDTNKKTIRYLIDNMIAKESRYLRNAYKAITPDLKIVGDFECSSCSHIQELEVPFGADFFWPDR